MGERKQAIERYQKGINLLKDGPPCLELVHLYEEAASLYMHAGDNMLAIYASEKALRLAEKLGETRVASRAHGIFGRVFGRIGDTAKARENLERSVELARDSDDAETIRALLTLGHHLEVSEADYDGASGAYGEALALAQQIGDLPAQVELQSSIAQVASYRADWDAVEQRPRRAPTWPSARASWASSASRACCAACCMARGRLGRRRALVPAGARAGRAGRLVGGRVLGALLARPRAARPRRPLRRGHRARPRARRLRARRADRPVDRGDVGARAIALAMAGKVEQAREAAEEAGHLAERLHYPVGERCGACRRWPRPPRTREVQSMMPRRGSCGAASAGRWTRRSRDLLMATLLAHARSGARSEALERAESEFERLGVEHLAGWARKVRAV